MKIKHLIIVSLILAILTIGAVSASEDIDDVLTVEDGGVDDVSASDEEVILENDGENTDPENPQVDISLEKKVYVDDNEDVTLEGDNFAVIHYLSDGDVEGNVSVEVDGVPCFDKELKDCNRYDFGDDSLRDYIIGVSDLSSYFGVGTYNVVVKYSNGFDSVFKTGFVKFASVNDPSPVEINLEHTIYIDDYDDQTFVGYNFAVIHYLSDGDVEGNVSVEVGGVPCFDKELKDCNLYDFGDESLKMYTIGYNDLNTQFDVGTYEIIVKYSNGFDTVYKTDSITFLSVDGVKFCIPTILYLKNQEFLYVTGVNNESNRLIIEINGEEYFNKTLSQCNKKVVDDEEYYVICLDKQIITDEEEGELEFTLTYIEENSKPIVQVIEKEFVNDELVIDDSSFSIVDVLKVSYLSYSGEIFGVSVPPVMGGRILVEINEREVYSIVNTWDNYGFYFDLERLEIETAGDYEAHVYYVDGETRIYVGLVDFTVMEEDDFIVDYNVGGIKSNFEISNSYLDEQSVNLGIHAPEDVEGNISITVNNGVPFVFELPFGDWKLLSLIGDLNIADNGKYELVFKYVSNGGIEKEFDRKTIYVVDEMSASSNNDPLSLDDDLESVAIIISDIKYHEGKIIVYDSPDKNVIIYECSLDDNDDLEIKLKDLKIDSRGNYTISISHLALNGVESHIEDVSLNLTQKLNVKDFDVSITKNTVTLGSNVPILRINAPKGLGIDGKIVIQVNNNSLLEFDINDDSEDYLEFTASSLKINEAGNSEINVKYVPNSGDEMILAQGNVIVNSDNTGNNGGSTKTDTQSQTPSKKADVIKLTLKKVTVKKSAKKLVLTATLKINGKYPKKGTKVTFKFNGKTYKAKTNAKGVAKVTIKKSVLKKLKVGKKVKYQVTYAKKTVKKSVGRTSKLIFEY